MGSAFNINIPEGPVIYQISATKGLKGRIEKEKDKLVLYSPYNLYLKDEIKAMEGAKWLGIPGEPDARKAWSVKDSQRNRFQLAFLLGMNPYAWYDRKVETYTPLRRKGDGSPWPMTHQIEMTSHMLTYHQLIIAAEMGAGKSLAAMECMDTAAKNGIVDALWIGPRSALDSVKYEFHLWAVCSICGKIGKEHKHENHRLVDKTSIIPRFMTYEELKKVVTSWPKGKPAPQLVVFDEASRAKNPTAQRSQAAQHLADSMRDEYGENAYIIEMTGTPAPKDPSDWYSLCVPSDTWIFTKEGPKQVKDLIEKPCLVNVDSKSFYSPTGFFYSGRKKLWEITTSRGYSFRASEDHPVLANYSGRKIWRKVKELKVGEDLVINNHSNFTWSGEGTFEEGYCIGLIISDGENNKRSGNFPISSRIILTGTKRQLSKFVQHSLHNFVSVNEGGNEQTTIRGATLTALGKRFKLDDQKAINSVIESGSSEFSRGLISAMFDMDGTVSKNRLRLILGQSDLPRLKSIQRLLLYYGIPSSIYLGREEGNYKCNQGYYDCKDHWLLCLSTIGARLFHERIGLLIKEKSDRLANEVANIKPYNMEKFITTITSIKEFGEEDLFDITVNDAHSFSANGFILHNCSIACPGFIREGTLEKFKRRLAKIENYESSIGGSFPKLITWWDNENKCAICGKFQDDPDHDQTNATEEWFHKYQKSTNEVLKLYDRMKGLVIVKRKADCLSLPEKIYKKVICRPTASVLRTADLIARSAKSTIRALTLLRELSDGFQYQETEDGVETCPTCKGRLKIEVSVDADDPTNPLDSESLARGHRVIWGEDGDNEYNIISVKEEPLKIIIKEIDCTQCGGSGEVPRYIRTSARVNCPKDQAVTDHLDLCSDEGRIVIWAGFTDSVDRCTGLCVTNQWPVIRLDGRGWWSNESSLMGVSPVEILKGFDDKDKYPKLAFVGQPGAGGMGLNLTASAMALYYSNTFKFEDRAQSEDRIHRIGADFNRGVTIVDLIHLPQDQLVLDNLKKKRDLQNMSMGMLAEASEHYSDQLERAI